MDSRTQKIIRDAFYNVQFNKTCHRNYLKKLKALYDRVDEDIFSEHFISCLTVSLTKGEKYPKVENTLEFAAKFASSLYSVIGDEVNEQMCPFITKLFDFLLTHHNAKDTAVRFRVCHFMNILLNSMGEDAFIDDALCDRISVNMMDRLLDKSPKVRAQAVFALHRLQDPADEECPVIKIFLFHLSKDPQVEVRKAVLMNMGKNQKTLQVALRRTRDVNDSVRKAAYMFISKVTVRSLTIDQREQLLSDGLKDRSDIVSKCVRDVLLPSWLRYFGGDYISLLRALDVENALETATLALNTLFKGAELKTIMDQVPVDPNTKCIPLNTLSSENVLYWRCLVQYLVNQSCTEELEEFLPELSKFCVYIQEFLTMMSSKSYHAWESMTHKCILLQLFEIIKTYDLSDEIGRENLKQLILDTLMTEHCSEKVTESIVEYLEIVIPDVDNRINSLTLIISELRMPLRQMSVMQITDEQIHEINMKRARLRVKLLEVTEEQYEAIQNKDYLKAESLKEKIEMYNREIIELNTDTDKDANVIENDDVCDEKNDRKTMIMCLGIMCAMMQVKSVKSLTPPLKSLMEDMALPSFDHPDDVVHILALKAVAICCLLDKELAKKHIMLFFLQFSVEQDNPEIWLAALKAIFDLLLLYGFEYFEIATHNEVNTINKKQKQNRTVKLYSNADDDNLISTESIEEEYNSDVVKILTGLLDNVNQDLRTVAAEGLCKLLLRKRISSASLLSRLIILWYSPVTESDFFLRQCLCSFFNNFAFRVPESQEMLEEAFLPTLRTLANAPDESPLQEIDPQKVTKLILNLTKINARQSGTGVYCSHNNLAFTILAEILNVDSDIDQTVLIKSLKYLEIQLEDDTAKNNLQVAVNDVIKMMKNTDKRLLKSITDFNLRLAESKSTQNQSTEQESHNELMES